MKTSNYTCQFKAACLCVHILWFNVFFFFFFFFSGSQWRTLSLIVAFSGVFFLLFLSSVLYKESNTFNLYMSHSSWLVHPCKFNESSCHLSQLMRLWYLLHRRPAEAQASLRIRPVSPEPSLLAHIKTGSRRRVRPNLGYLAPVGGRACAFEECV